MFAMNKKESLAGSIAGSNGGFDCAKNISQMRCSCALNTCKNARHIFLCVGINLERVSVGEQRLHDVHNKSNVKTTIANSPKQKSSSIKQIELVIYTFALQSLSPYDKIHYHIVAVALTLAS
jgi:hypothetical protein